MGCHPMTLWFTSFMYPEVEWFSTVKLEMIYATHSMYSCEDYWYPLSNRLNLIKSLGKDIWFRPLNMHMLKNKPLISIKNHDECWRENPNHFPFSPIYSKQNVQASHCFFIAWILLCPFRHLCRYIGILLSHSINWDCIFFLFSSFHFSSMLRTMVLLWGCDENGIMIYPKSHYEERLQFCESCIKNAKQENKSVDYDTVEKDVRLLCL